MSRPRNASGNHSWVTMSDADIAALMRQVKPDVDRVLEGIAGQIADEARASTAFNDTGITVEKKRNMEFGQDVTRRHKHLRQTIEPKKSRFDDGGYIVRATAPHAHLVEFGHLKVLWGKVTSEHVPAHSFLRKAKNDVMARLAPVLQWN